MFMFFYFARIKTTKTTKNIRKKGRRENQKKTYQKQPNMTPNLSKINRQIFIVLLSMFLGFFTDVFFLFCRPFSAPRRHLERPYSSHFRGKWSPKGYGTEPGKRLFLDRFGPRPPRTKSIKKTLFFNRFGQATPSPRPKCNLFRYLRDFISILPPFLSVLETIFQEKICNNRCKYITSKSREKKNEANIMMKNAF